MATYYPPLYIQVPITPYSMGYPMGSPVGYLMGYSLPHSGFARPRSPTLLKSPNSVTIFDFAPSVELHPTIKIMKLAQEFNEEINYEQNISSFKMATLEPIEKILDEYRATNKRYYPLDDLLNLNVSNIVKAKILFLSFKTEVVDKDFCISSLTNLCNDSSLKSLVMIPRSILGKLTGKPLTSCSNIGILYPDRFVVKATDEFTEILQESPKLRKGDKQFSFSKVNSIHPKMKVFLSYWGVKGMKEK